MSGTNTIRMIAAYLQMAAPTMFLSGMFRSPSQNFHNAEEVEIDIVRCDEDIAIVIEDLTTGYRMNSADLFTNKAFKPPIFKEAVPIDSFDLLKRMPGDSPFDNVEFRSKVIVKMFNGMVKVERKIRRAIEEQAAQVLQTGVVTLKNEAGVALYTLDFKPKATHFPTTSNSWDGAGATIASDIGALGEVIRSDGLSDPNELVMGVDAFEAAITNDDFKARFDNRRIDQGRISPMEQRGQGGSYRGIVEIGNYRYDIWTYGGRYKDPETGVSTQYIDPKKVVVKAADGRLDATFGAIPNIGKALGVQNTTLIPELPGRISNEAGGMDLFTNMWITADGEQLFGGVGARPLMIPTAIDTYGCITAITP